jgi:release factor glutamine methyltransferase
MVIRASRPFLLWRRQWASSSQSKLSNEKCSATVQLKNALQCAIQELEHNDVGSPRLNAETLMMFTLGCDRAYLYAHPERELAPDECSRFTAAINERAAGKPAQYITGHQEFWGLDLIVSPAVLIPRPETEHVIETVLSLAADRKTDKLRIVDIGTGSGALALALAHEFRQAEIHATDISVAALEIARINAERLGMRGRIYFHLGDLLQPFSGDDTFDFIVCNPPYVSELHPEDVQKQVREHEPKVAVFSGPTGLEIYERLIPQARAHLASHGWLVMEIGFSIEAKVRALLSGWAEVRVTNDLQGIARVLSARRYPVFAG